MSKKRNRYKGIGIRIKSDNKRPKGKHTNIVDSLERRLLDSNTHYTCITKEEKFKTFSGKDGECDDYALNHTPNKLYLLLFEVKTTDNHKNRSKAHQQLTKDKAYYSKLYNVDRTYMFYVHGIPKTNDYKINRYIPK